MNFFRMKNKLGAITLNCDRITFCRCIVAVAVFLIVGCIHLPASHLPPSWDSTPVAPAFFADDPNRGRLQVIIAYSDLVENHTALRLSCPGRQVIFWDPGGEYNLKKAPHTRKNDLIVIDPPDLETYLKFRSQFKEAAVEIFEWDLETAQAVKLYDILVNGTGENHPEGYFQTETQPFFCSTAVSSFLKRFAYDVVTVSDIYFWPNDLAQVLYSQNPDRVLIFRRKHPPVVYIPPPQTMGDSQSVKSEEPVIR